MEAQAEVGKSSCENPCVGRKVAAADIIDMVVKDMDSVRSQLTG